MIFKIGTEYLDVETQPEIESQSVLFENVSEVKGDFSYSITAPRNHKNIRLLGIESINKRLNQNIECTALSDNGQDIYVGFIRVERVEGNQIFFSFFSGNTNWIDLLNVPLRNSFDFSELDTDIFAANIASTFGNNSGIVFPVVDRGAMGTRSTNAMWEQDFQPFVFVREIIKIVCRSSGIKIEGDFNTDSVIQKLITTNNGLSGLQQRIIDRTAYIGKQASQTLTLATWDTIEWDDVSSPYSNSRFENWDTATFKYTADVDYKKLSVEVNVRFDDNIWGRYRFLINGVAPLETSKYTAMGNLNKKFELVEIAAGDTIEFQIRRETPPAGISGFGGTDVLEGSWIKVTPVKFYKGFADQYLPDLTAGEFIAQIFALRNIIPTYDPYSKTIHTKKFNNILVETPIDISQYLDGEPVVDYVEFISGYSKKNYFLYEEQSSDFIDEYNKSRTTPYGGGSLDVDDNSLSDDSDLLTLDFVAPAQIMNEGLGTSLPFLDYVEVEETDNSVSVTSVTNESGYARFNFSGSNPFTANSLVRVRDMSNDQYNGDYRILVNSASYVILQDIFYDSTATGTIAELEFVENNNEDQVLLIYQPGLLPSDFTGFSQIWFNASYSTPEFSYAFFYLPNLGLNINTMREALYFDTVDDPAAYQIGLLNNYSATERALNDPVKVTGNFYIPESVFNQLTQNTPIRLTTQKFNCLFYLNKKSGYKGSKYPCVLELIKLS